MAFGPGSKNPREKRAYAHLVISEYKRGERSFGDALNAAHSAAGTTKGRASGFEGALGGIIVDGTNINVPGDNITVAGFTPHLFAAIEAARQTGHSFTFRHDVVLRHEGAETPPPTPGAVMTNHLGDGFYAIVPTYAETIDLPNPLIHDF